MTSLRRFVPLLAVGLLLVAAAVAALLASPQIRPVPAPRPHLPTPEPTVFGTPPAGPPKLTDPTVTSPENSGVQLPDWLVGVAQVLCVAVVLAAVGLVLWLLLRGGLRARRGKLPETAEPAKVAREDVLAVVDAGLSELDDSDADPRRAVIACWVRLEQAAAAAGTPRAPGDTSTDLVGRLLAEHQVSALVLYQLAEVFRLARYATHTVDSAMRDQARAALQQLRAELARPAPVGTPS
jgi:hypothetical protein